MNLGDPELELIDPTPNVHLLFVHFDKLFFWARLTSKAFVRWSKRMYSCAGTCTYRGPGDACDIALSEPLLKLRPRKDLIETLLHEMIHAYLFITDRDNDRDGHGPKFKSHMYRINQAAGLDISIYHDFHDEVKLYLNHWWRCNGPCQNWKPHFGVVRLAINRAPGPHDYWWKNHQKKCGGTFIKIKEPEKKQKKSAKTNPVVSQPNADITKYFVKNVNTTNNNNNFVTDKNMSLKNTNINTITSIKSNNPNTVVIAKKDPLFKPQPIPKPKLLTGGGQVINGGRERTSSASVLENVRNVWANKQLPLIPLSGGINKLPSVDSGINKKPPAVSPVPKQPSKHKPETHADSPPSKIKKIDDYFKKNTSILKDIYGEDFKLTQPKSGSKLVAVKVELVDCPICYIKVDSTLINRHLDECLNEDVIKHLTKDKVEVHATSNNTTKNKLKDVVGDIPQIPAFKGNITASVDLTQAVFSTSSYIDIHSLVDNIDNKVKDKDRKSVGHIPVKEKENTTPANSNNIKVEPSTSQSNNSNAEPGSSKLNTSQSCPCCGDDLNKSIEEHLEDCVGINFINNEPVEGASTSAITTIVIDDDEDDAFDDSQICNATGTKCPCPCCLEMVELADMNNHLDNCLGS